MGSGWLFDRHAKLGEFATVMDRVVELDLELAISELDVPV